ncbi:MAG: energy-coupling factor transporter transmembrane protein EcfT [Clostridia bacterium]|nr:energy-coupling factor transporter transmembrane protein EcfT [Clostridia bacterium]
MERTTAMDRVHPGVSLLFFVCAVGGTLLPEHPLFRVCALGGALCCHAVLCTGGGRFLWRTAAPVCAFAAVLNPLFNHRGAHILFYFPWGNPCTGESLLFGLSAAALLLCVLLWFRCYTAVMTSEKSLFLFSRAAPSLTLLLRLSLRFVPAFRRALLRTRDAQTALLGPPRTKKEALRRAFSATRIRLRDALQTAADTADAMKSRGYGLPGRTCFAAFRLRGRDAAALLFLLGCALPVFGLWAAGGLRFSFFPLPSGAPVSPLTAFCAALYTALCLFPVILHRSEVSRWNSCKSTV